MKARRNGWIWSPRAPASCSLREQEAPGVFHPPGDPLSDTALITNAPEDPSLGFELRAELATADRVDLLCAFVKWHGLRILEESLRLRMIGTCRSGS